MGLKMLDPCAFAKLDHYYAQVETIIELVKTSETLNGLIPGEFIEGYTKYRQLYKQALDLTKCAKYSLQCIEDNIFNHGCYPELDKISASINQPDKLIQDLVTKLGQLIDPTKPMIYLKVTADGEISMTITQIRFEILKKKFLKPIVIADELTVAVDDLTIVRSSKGKGSKTHDITCPQLKTLMTMKTDAIETLTEKIAEVYREFLEKLYQEHETVLKQVDYLVAQWDVYQSTARTTLKYHYCRPQIVAGGKSELQAKSDGPQQASNGSQSRLQITALRHPLVEIINQHEVYTAHDVTLNPEALHGLLIFGVNASGKTVLMKSVGIAVIMAQAGFYVPADSMSYTPYSNVMTRILGNDDLHKGKSTFAVEISEVISITNRVDAGCLVLGDEVCKGTENVSGTAIVGGVIDYLNQKGAHFVFATHLHGLAEFPEVVSDPHIGVFHLRVEVKDERLIYHRQLTPGIGSSLYGLEVARFYGMKPDLWTKCNSLRQRLLGLPTALQSTETSRYNSGVYKPAVCPVCQKREPIETHHIRPQRDADEHGFIGHIHKNHADNLVWLCRTCHLQTENGVDGKLLVFTDSRTFEFRDVNKAGEHL
jgi:DNA mismatch repair protein MutS